ncbi:MAG: ABC transporter ATP-binding protein/permease [Chloroflexi bacterium]|nr:ABC transporter ATP-binding protein/permease [Chloroflexota bacterium]
MTLLLRILKYLTPYKSRVGLAYTCILVSSLLSLAVPWLLKEVIDRGLVAGDYGFLVVAALIVVGLSVLKGLFYFGQTYLVEYLSQRVANDLRNDLYAHLLRLPFSFHDRTPTGQSMARLTSDVDVTQRFVSFGLTNIVNGVIVFFTVATVLFWLDWRLALVSLAVVPFLAARAVTVGRKLRPMFVGVQQQFANMTTVLQENLSGVRVVRAFGREKYEMDKFSRENWELLERNVSAVRIWAFNAPLMAFLTSLGTAGILWYGGREVIAGHLSIGTLVAFNSYLVILAWPIRIVGWLVNLTARVMASAERVFEVLDAPSNVIEVPSARELPPIRGHIRFENVSFNYDGQNNVLSDLNLEAEPGQVIALVGPPGSGKSTVVSLLPRFYDVASGRLTIDGYDVRELGLSSLRRQIGLVLQDTFLFSISVRENIAYGLRAASLEAIVAAARSAHAHEFIEALPEGYNTVVGERGITLSGGQRQRIAIARALLLDPPLLILDDATSSVDTETAYLIQMALAQLMKGRTTFVIAHRLDTVKNADQIFVLRDGRIVEKGTHGDLLRQQGLYSSLYELQQHDEALPEEIDGEGRTTGLERPTDFPDSVGTRK